METFSVNRIADQVQRVGKTLGLAVTIKNLENPRKEAEEHYYNPAHSGLLELGLKPHYLTDDTMAEMMEMVLKYKDNIRKETIFRGVKW